MDFFFSFLERIIVHGVVVVVYNILCLMDVGARKKEFANSI